MNTLSHLMQILNPDGTLPILIECDETGEPDYAKLVWESETVPRPSKKAFEQALAQAKSMQYKNDRRSAYPTIEEQLDILFHGGLEEWRAKIQEIKTKYPKPS